MSVSMQPLTEETLAAAGELVLEFWHRAWDPQFTENLLRWRFLQRPNGETLLVMDGDRCVGMIDSFLRSYLLDGNIATVRELGDWYSRPEYRGIGLKTMRTMMKKPEPSLSIGGSEVTQLLLPKLGWKPLAHPAADYSLTVTGAAPVNAVSTRFGIPGKRLTVRLANRFIHPRRWFKPRPKHSENATVRPYLGASAAIIGVPSAGSYQIASLIGHDEVEWLRQAPDKMGQFIVLEFLVDDDIAGITVSRVFDLGFLQQANILQVQTSCVSMDMYRCMIEETTNQLVAKGASSVRCRTSCVILGAALKELHFRKRDNLQTVWWNREQDAPQGPVLLSHFRADDGIQPLPL